MSWINIDWLDWLLEPGRRTFWGFWLSSAAIAMGWGLLNWHQRSPYLLQWFKKEFWLHHSAVQDYLLILLNSLLFSILGISTLLLVIETANQSYSFLRYFSDGAFVSASGRSLLLFTIVLILVDDLSRYGLHRALHSRWLWRIHRLHHSAQVLTPLTFLRLHPLEQLLFQCRAILVHGVLAGSYFFITEKTPEHWLIFGVSGSVFLFNVLGANLRHSHIPIGYGRLEKLFISPAQHQYHHATQGVQTNYGSVFAVWDYCFRSWHSSNNADLSLPKHSMPLIQQLLLKR